MANLKELKINGIDIIDIIYPVGSIYLTINTQDPSEVIGGEWELWGKGKTIVGVDNSQTEFNSVEKTGGEKTHELTENEMPSHVGHLYQNSGTVPYYGNTAVYLNTDKMTAYGSVGRGWSNNASEIYPAGLSRGANTPHNNLQPYITCYMWKRIS